MNNREYFVDASSVSGSECSLEQKVIQVIQVYQQQETTTPSREKQTPVISLPLFGSSPSVSSTHETNDRNHNNSTLDAWSRLVKSTHGPLLTVLQWIARQAVLRPWCAIVSVILLSSALMGVGIARGGFSVSTSNQFTPAGSRPEQHSSWISDKFVGQRRLFSMLIHAQGENVLMDIERVFTALETIRSIPGYATMCIEEETNTTDCEVYSVASYWNNNVTAFREATRENPVETIGKTIQKSVFPNGEAAPLSYLYGNQVDDGRGTIVSVESYSVSLFFTPGRKGRVFERKALTAALALQKEWRATQGGVQLEVSAEGSVGYEFERTITQDIPLVPLIFCIMSLFTAVAFSRHDKVRSRSLLGVAAVCAVMLSIASGFGLLFLCFVPFTSLTQILPFIIFGIGLDDAFIMIGAYERTHSSLSIEERMFQTIDDVGLSITLTTLTSAVAFALGCLSSVYGVYWLCLYAIPTILFVFLYQLTFFVACIVLDERRIQANRRDICLCLQVKSDRTNGEEEEHEHFADRIMGQYAKVLLLRPVKALVVVGFAVLFGFSCVSALKFEEQFDVTEALPRDSYVLTFSKAYDAYRDTGPLRANVYFRDVDQSSPVVQAQMREYIAALQETPYFNGTDPFWLDFFGIYDAFGDQNRTFTEKMDDFLSLSLYRDLFERDIVRNKETGEIEGSRVRIRLSVDVNDAQEHIKLLRTQREVSLNAAINQGKDEFTFFTYDGVYKVWEFLSIAKQELFLTASVGVVAVSFVAAIFIPHWSAVLFVFPLICVLYIDLLGMMQWAGLYINPVSYVSLAMSIGLLVDFVMHILFRYYELPGTRHEKVVEMLRTIGASILLGGTTTFLGTIPLMFSSSDVFETVFFTFLGIVTLGMGHGLILVPVLLSLFGPEVQISMSGSKKSSSSTSSESSSSRGAEGDSASPPREEMLDVLENVDAIEDGGMVMFGDHKVYEL